MMLAANLPIRNDANMLKNEGNLTRQGLVGLEKALHAYAFEDSSLSVGREIVQ